MHKPTKPMVRIVWRDGDLDGKYRHLLSIPKESVVEIVELKSGKAIDVGK